MSGLPRVVARSGGPITAVVLCAVYMYARLQGLGVRDDDGPSLPGHSRAGVGSRLAASRLARHPLRFRMRDGSRVRCRIVDSGGLLSVHVDGDYELPGVAWQEARSIVDVGAHVGSFTVWAARRAPKARILAVEPNPESFALLAENIHANGLDDRVTAVQAAVGPQSGQAALAGMHHSLGTHVAPYGSGEADVAVRMDTLPALLEESSMHTIDLLKIDCEGMEYDVFEALGADRLTSVEAVACEYHPQPGRDVAQLVRILDDAGFSVRRTVTPVGMIWGQRSRQSTV